MVRALGNRRRPSQSLSAVAPSPTSADYSHELADLAAHILYCSPLPSQNDLPIYILNAAAFPDAKQTDYDSLLPYVLARLPGEDDLIGGLNYEVIFFAGAGGQGATSSKKGLPGWGWLLQAYHLLTRALRKRLQKLYIVHEKTWIRMLIEAFSTVITPKGRRKIVHVSTMGQLALLIPIQDLQLPPSVLTSDRRFCPRIDVPYTHGKRAFGAAQPLPAGASGIARLPRVLREATKFVLLEPMLKTEGIFRLSARSQTLDVLKEAYVREQKFIVWKEGDSMMSSVHRRDGHGNVQVEDLTRTDGYDLHTATSLIKQWYKDLQEPIFPQSSYSVLKRVIVSKVSDIATSVLVGMLVDSNDWSPLSKISRQIMLKHLLPLLSTIVEYQDANQMDSRNLAICFAPTLLRGIDPKEDIEMMSIVQNILEHMIRAWKDTLGPTFHMDRAKFEEMLSPPENIDEWEDPLEVPSGQAKFNGNQSHGSIALMESNSDNEAEEERPPLPPRPTFSSMEREQVEAPLPVRRKPAPAMATLPRYSAVIREAPPTLHHLPSYNTGGTGDDDFEAADPNDLPPYESSSMNFSPTSLPATNPNSASPITPSQTTQAPPFLRKLPAIVPEE